MHRMFFTRMLITIRKFLARPTKRNITDELAGSLARFVPPEKRNVPLGVVRREALKIMAEEVAHEGLNV